MSTEDFKNRLNDFESTSENPELNWDAIGPSIIAGVKKDKKKRRIFPWFFWGIGIIAILLVLSTVVFNSSDHTDESSQRSAEAQINEMRDLNNSGNIENRTPEQSNSSITSVLIPSESISRNRSLTDQENKNTLTNTEFEINLNNERTRSTDLLIQNKVSPTIVDSESNILVASPKNSQSTTLNKTVSQIPSTRGIELNTIASLDHRLQFTQIISLTAFGDIQNPSEIDQKVVSTPSWSLTLRTGVNRSNSADFYAYSNSLNGFSSELELTKHINNRWLISAGLRYDQFRFKSSYEIIDTIRAYKPQTIDTIITDGRFEQYIYTDTVDAERSRRFRHTNTLTMISAPITVGHEFRFKRWTIQSRAGIVLNLSNTLNGRTSDVDYTITDHSGSFYDSINIGWTGSFNAAYELTNSLGLQLGINGLIMPSIVEGNTKKLTSIGASIGLIKRW